MICRILHNKIRGFNKNFSRKIETGNEQFYFGKSRAIFFSKVPHTLTKHEYLLGLDIFLSTQDFSNRKSLVNLEKLIEELEKQKKKSETTYRLYNK